MATDPVCGSELPPKSAEWLVSYDERVYYFCSANCKRLFEANPLTYYEPGHIDHEIEAVQNTIAVADAVPRVVPTLIAISR